MLKCVDGEDIAVIVILSLNGVDGKVDFGGESFLLFRKKMMSGVTIKRKHYYTGLNNICQAQPAILI